MQLFLLLAAWTLVGIYGGPLIYGILPLTLLLMKKRGFYEEMFFGFFYVLIISDSLELPLLFAKDLKNFYILTLSFFFLFDTASFSPVNRLYKIFVPFFVFSYFTVLFSVRDPFFITAVQKTLSYTLVLMVLPNYFMKIYREGKQEFLRRLIFFAVTALFIGFILKYTMPSVAFLEVSDRFRGVMGNPNGLGLYSFLLFVLFYVINDYFPQLFTKKEKYIVYFAILYSIFLADSRNSVLAVVIFYSFHRFFNLSPFLGFIFFLAFVFLSEIISNNLQAIIISYGLQDFFRINTLEDGSGRYVAWEFAWKQIQHNFFIGKGFGYNEYYMRQHYHELGKLGHQGGIHNSFLTFWMDQGLIGLLIYLRSYVLVFIKGAKQSKMAFPILFSFSFTAIFESWLVGSLSAFAFYATIIYTLLTSEEFVAARENSSPELNPALANEY
jgi:O-antigen ligase